MASPDQWTEHRCQSASWGAGDVRPERDPRQTLKALFFLTIASFTFGLVCFWNYLQAEHRRLDPEMGLLVWVSDVVGFLWFSWFFFKHYVLGESFRQATGGSARLTLAWWLALFSLLVALGADIWLMTAMAEAERAGQARAIEVTGEIVALERTSGSEFHSYTIHCRFRDQQGEDQEGSFQVHEHRRTHQFQEALPADVRQAVRNRIVPFAIPMTYDPQLPARNWIAGSAAGDSNRFHAFSLCIRIFQIIGIFNFGVFLWQAIRTSQTLPWWYDLHMVLPFMIEAAVLGFFGGLMAGIGFLVHLAFD